MPKFRKRPIVIEAEQFSAFSSAPIAGVCGYGCMCTESGDYCDDLHVHTLEGTLNVSDGDWIVQGTQGEHWPVRADIFAATYEPPAPRRASPAPRRLAVGEHDPACCCHGCLLDTADRHERIDTEQARLTAQAVEDATAELRAERDALKKQVEELTATTVALDAFVSLARSQRDRLAALLDDEDAL